MKETIFDLVRRSRTVRKYEEKKPISRDILLEIVDAAHLTASAGNRQPTRFIIVNGKTLNEEVFKSLGWLGYIAENRGPKVGERPSAYIILLYDNKIENASVQYDGGIVSQTIILCANSIGLGCCIIGAINHSKLRILFNIPPDLGITSVIAIGYPKEVVVLEQSLHPMDIEYWRDKNEIHHVPKLSLDQVIVGDYCDD